MNIFFCITEFLFLMKFLLYNIFILVNCICHIQARELVPANFVTMTDFVTEAHQLTNACVDLDFLVLIVLKVSWKCMSGSKYMSLNFFFYFLKKYIYVVYVGHGNVKDTLMPSHEQVHLVFIIKKYKIFTILMYLDTLIQTSCKIHVQRI